MRLIEVTNSEGQISGGKILEKEKKAIIESDITRLPHATRIEELITERENHKLKKCQNKTT